MTNKNFKYLDIVKIIKGFYEGQVGQVVKSYYSDGKYDVRLINDGYIAEEVFESFLELI